MKNNIWFTITYLIFIIVLVKIFTMFYKKTGTKFLPEKTKCFYINLDKNKFRNEEMIKTYNNSDLSKYMSITRFPAVLGKNVDIDKWLTPEAVIQIKETEKTNTRTHHYQMTRGAVGCFLSHYTLAKQLKNDPESEYYIIFEDDIAINKNFVNYLNNYLQLLPKDWDIVQFYAHRKTREFKTIGQFYKPQGFWGTQGYIINKKGAKKLVKEVEQNKIDGQIDAYLSRMIQQDKINLYITKNYLVSLNTAIRDTDIQCPVIRKNINDNPSME